VPMTREIVRACLARRASVRIACRPPAPRANRVRTYKRTARTL